MSVGPALVLSGIAGVLTLAVFIVVPWAIGEAFFWLSRTLRQRAGGNEP